MEDKKQPKKNTTDNVEMITMSCARQEFCAYVNMNDFPDDSDNKLGLILTDLNSEISIAVEKVRSRFDVEIRLTSQFGIVEPERELV